MIKLKSILTEARKLDQKHLDKIHKFTQRNNHGEARVFLSQMLQNDKLYRFYNAMAILNDIFGGDGPEQSKLKQKMEKVLYKDIKKKYANSAEIIGKKEMENEEVSIRTLADSETETMSVKETIKKLKKLVLSP